MAIENFRLPANENSSSNVFHSMESQNVVPRICEFKKYGNVGKLFALVLSTKEFHWNKNGSICINYFKIKSQNNGHSPLSRWNYL